MISTSSVWYSNLYKCQVLWSTIWSTMNHMQIVDEYIICKNTRLFRSTFHENKLMQYSSAIIVYVTLEHRASSCLNIHWLQNICKLSSQITAQVISHTPTRYFWNVIFQCELLGSTRWCLLVMICIYRFHE